MQTAMERMLFCFYLQLLVSWELTASGIRILLQPETGAVQADSVSHVK
jgi:hypothetical protein